MISSQKPAAEPGGYTPEFLGEGVAQEGTGWRRRAGEGEGAWQGTAVNPLALL